MKLGTGGGGAVGFRPAESHSGPDRHGSGSAGGPASGPRQLVDQRLPAPGEAAPVFRLQERGAGKGSAALFA